MSDILYVFTLLLNLQKNKINEENMPLKLFHGDIANGILVVTIAIDIYVISTPYWATIERLVEGGPNIGRGVVFGFWEVCENDKSSDASICTNFNLFFKKYRNQGSR